MQARRGALTRVLHAAAGLGLALVIALGLVVGCGDDDESPLASKAELRDLVIVAGDNQTAEPGASLEQSLTVQAVGQGGRPVAGVEVRFAVIAGGGALLDTSGAKAPIRVMVTGADGRAQIRLQLGPVPGVNRVAATVDGLEGLPPTFTAKAVGPEGEEGGEGVVLPVAGRYADGAHFSLAVEKLNMPGGVRFGEVNRITAYVYDAESNPVPEGTVVHFRTSGGGIEEQARTDASGQASVALTMAGPVPADGWATVTAETAGGQDSVVTATARVLFSGSPEVRLVSPDTFRVATGGSVTVEFYVGDTNGHPLVSGTAVQVTAEGGQIVGESSFVLPDTQSPDATRFVVAFQAAEGSQVRRLIIAVSSPNGNLETAFASRSERPEPASIVVVSVDPPAIGVRGTGTNETALTVFEVRDALGDKIADGTPVLFRLRGVSGRVQPDSAGTAAGRVQAVVSSDTLSGTVQLVAMSLLANGDTVRSEPVAIAIHGGLPDEGHFSLALEKLNVHGGVLFGLEDRVTAFVFDRYANPVPAGTVVYFTTDGGGIGGSAATNAAGQASVALTTASPVPADGWATVTARTLGAAGEPLEETAQVLFSGHPQVRLVSPDTFRVAPEGSVVLAFYVGDGNGHPLVQGTTVSVTAEGGEIVGESSFELPDTQSPTATLFGVVFQAAATGALPQVTVEVASPNGNAQATFVGELALEGPEVAGYADAEHFSLAVEKLNMPGGVRSGEVNRITAYVYDAESNPVPEGTVVRFQTSSGGIEKQAVTDAAGQASVLLTTAGPMPADGWVTVTAETAGEGGSVVTATARILFSGTPEIRLVSPDSIQVAPGERANLVFYVGDGNGYPLSSGTVVTASAVGGEIVGRSSFTLTDTQSEEDTRFAVEFQASEANERRQVTVAVSSPNGNREVAFVIDSEFPEPASIVVVSVDPPALGVRGAGANENAAVVFEVRDALGNKVADGEPILFKLNGVPSHVQPDSTVTAAGRVRAVVGSNTIAGPVQLVAEAGLASGDTVRSEPVVIAVHGGLPDGEHFSIRATSPNIATPSGVPFGQEVSIIAYVFDRYANPVPAGTAIYFTTDGGGIEGSAVTNAAGQASVLLTAVEPVPENGVATVTARTLGVDGVPVEATTQVLFSGAPQVRLIQPANFSVAPGEIQTIHFFVGDANGHPLASGTTIAVSAEGGTIIGESEFVLLDTQSPDATRFAVDFQADAEGIPRMTIQVTSPNGNKQVVLISGQESPGQEGVTRVPAQLLVVAEDSVLVADGISETAIRAAVLDSAGNGVAGQTVEFSADVGRVDAVALTDAAGQAIVNYRSAMHPDGVPEVVVRAHTGTLSGETRLRLLGVRLRLLSSSATLAADGIEQSTITAVLETEEGTPISFVPVVFAATLGSLSASQATTEVTGQASVVYTGVASPEDLEGVRVRARAAGLDTSVDLELLGVQLQLSVSPDTIAADGNAQAALSLHLQRSDGVPIPNAEIGLETSLGELSDPVVETDAAGDAQGILVAGTEAGKAIVKAAYGEGLTQRVAVAFVKGPPTSIVILSVEPPAIGVQGAGANETSLITFEVRDARGNTVADGEPVLFRLIGPLGSGQVGPDSTQTVDGRVHASVRSGTVAGTVQLIAIAASPLARGDTIRSEPVPIAIHGGHPDQLHFSVAPAPVNLAGRVVLGLESKVTAYVFDQYANPVPKGTAVYFTTDGGGIQGSGLTDENGQTTVTLFTANPMPPEGPVPPQTTTYLATVAASTMNQRGETIETTTTVLFSGSTAPIQVSEDNIVIQDGGQRIITFRVADIDGNPLMANSTIKVTSDVARVAGNTNVIMPDVRSGHTDYSILIADPAPQEDPPLDPQIGSVLITVESFNGNAQRVIGVSVD